ncbi:hypothetical protein ACGE24_05695 [Corynebacterium kroppenstedtii]|uniref:hypothetical protein n=1 Tax=Corynebacterium sp. PCR 32 TaxID=3351342 RepID=UPI0030B5BF5F
MDLDNLKDKAKNALSDNRDKVEEKVDEVADSKLGDNADKAKDGIKKGLDSLDK